jgi:hypothetical protein
VTVTSFGLPVAPVAVTRIVPARDDVLVFCVNAAVITPPFVPLEPDWIDSHPLPDVTAAVQAIVPAPAFETLNVVVPDWELTSRLSGATESIGGGSPA